MAKTESLYPPRELRDLTKERRAWLTTRLAEATATGRTGRVVGTGSYQKLVLTIDTVPEMRLQLCGLCQACGRQQAVTQGLIAHHGYQRPGSGYQTQSCAGARQLSLSEGIAVTERVALAVTDIITTAERALRDAPTKTTTTRLREHNEGWRRVKVPVTITRETAAPFVPHYTLFEVKRNDPTVQDAFDVLLRQDAATLAADIQLYRGDLDTLTTRIADYHAGRYVGTTVDTLVPV